MKNLWPFKAKSNGSGVTDHRRLETRSDSGSPHDDQVPPGESAPPSHEPSVLDSDRAATSRLPRLRGELHTELVTPRFVELVPRDFARQHLIISQGQVPPSNSSET